MFQAERHLRQWSPPPDYYKIKIHIAPVTAKNLKTGTNISFIHIAKKELTFKVNPHLLLINFMIYVYDVL